MSKPLDTPPAPPLGSQSDFDLAAWAQDRLRAMADALLVAPSSAPVSWGAALSDIAAERRRQIEVGGRTAQHDDGHRHGEIADAAADFAMTGQKPLSWSWAYRSKVVKREPRRLQLVKAGALIVAEIERLDRLAAKRASRR